MNTDDFGFELKELSAFIRVDPCPISSFDRRSTKGKKVGTRMNTDQHR